MASPIQYIQACKIQGNTNESLRDTQRIYLRFTLLNSGRVCCSTNAESMLLCELVTSLKKTWNINRHNAHIVRWLHAVAVTSVQGSRNSFIIGIIISNPLSEDGWVWGAPSRPTIRIIKKSVVGSSK